MNTRTLLTLFLAGLLCLFASSPARAQAGTLLFVDETGQLDRALVQTAAQPLIDAGATVAVYAVTEGVTPRLNALMTADGVLTDGALAPSLVALFVSQQAQFSFVRVGANWAAALGSQTAVIRTQDLQPNVEAGDLGAGMLAALNRMSGVITGTVERVDRSQALAADYTGIRNGLLIGLAAVALGYVVGVRFIGIKNATINLGIYILLTGLAIYSILPFIWMLSSSLKPIGEIFAQPPQLITPSMSLDAFIFVFEDGISRTVINTFVLATLFTLVTLFFSTLAGYGFSKFDFPGRKWLFRLLLAIMLVPGAVTIIPTYFIMLRLGWVDTLLPLVVPGAANAYAIFFMRQYILAVPDELIDSARIDGCTEFGVWWRVVVPIVTPGMTSLGLISFMATWNNYLGPLIYLRSPENWTLPLYHMNLTTYISNGRPWPEWMAVGVISVVPTLLIYILFQRRFTEGIAAGAVKA
jgi:ABC-type glycerol-3-phosphate transport system permease component